MKFVFAFLALACAAMAIEVFINTDNIHNKHADAKMLNDIAALLRKKGYTTKIGGIGPNYHYTEAPKVAHGGIFFPMFGGACAGTLMEMYNRTYSTYFFNTLKNRNAKMVVGFLSPPSTNIHNLAWLPRAHDDNFSPRWFKGASWPEKKLLNAGYGVVIGANPEDIVSKFPGFKTVDEEATPEVDIDAAIKKVGGMAEHITYSGRCQTHDCVAKYHTGDCWGMSDYLACELKKLNVQTKILQYPTAYSSNHRSIKYKNATGEWVRFPYRRFAINMLFRDTDAVAHGHEVAKNC